METIALEIPPELAERIKPYRDDLTRILQLGLHEWETLHKGGATVSLRERTLRALRATGLIEPLSPAIVERYVPTPRRRRHGPIKAAGKPASEIIIEHRRRR
jgi:hypothetical protein